MKVRIENKSTAQFLYPQDQRSILSGSDRPLKCWESSYDFKKIGKSFENISIFQRFVQVIRSISLISFGILFIGLPFLNHSYRKAIKNSVKEIWIGQEKIVHLIPFGGDKHYKVLQENIQLSRMERCFADVKDAKEARVNVKIVKGDESAIESFPIINFDQENLSNSFQEIRKFIQSTLSKPLNNNATEYSETVCILGIYKDVAGQIYNQYLYIDNQGKLTQKREFSPLSRDAFVEFFQTEQGFSAQQLLID